MRRRLQIVKDWIIENRTTAAFLVWLACVTVALLLSE